jgi:hypothetical protein
MAFFGSSWLEDKEDEEIGPLSHWLEDGELYDTSYPCDTCIHNGRCDRQKYMSAGDDCDNWSENKKR